MPVRLGERVDFASIFRFLTISGGFPVDFHVFGDFLEVFQVVWLCFRDSQICPILKGDSLRTIYTGRTKKGSIFDMKTPMNPSLFGF